MWAEGPVDRENASVTGNKMGGSRGGSSPENRFNPDGLPGFHLVWNVPGRPRPGPKDKAHGRAVLNTGGWAR